MTIKEFKGLSVQEMCRKMNAYMKDHKPGNFKSRDMNFTYTAAKTALESEGAICIKGVFFTPEEAVPYLEKSIKEQEPPKELSQENIEQLLTLCEDERFKRLLKITERYDYISNYILREDTGVKIKTGEKKDIRSTSFRVYGETLERWKEFTSENRAYSALDLLNTAMLEFMERHKKY